MLPFQIITALRSTDPVTLEQCRQAMIEEGASHLLGDDNLQLRFPTREEADAAKHRLEEKLPGSEQVWKVRRDGMDRCALDLYRGGLSGHGGEFRIWPAPRREI